MTKVHEARPKTLDFEDANKKEFNLKKCHGCDVSRSKSLNQSRLSDFCKDFTRKMGPEPYDLLSVGPDRISD